MFVRPLGWTWQTTVVSRSYLHMTHGWFANLASVQKSGKGPAITTGCSFLSRFSEYTPNAVRGQPGETDGGCLAQIKTTSGRENAPESEVVKANKQKKFFICVRSSLFVEAPKESERDLRHDPAYISARQRGIATSRLGGGRG